MIYKPLTNNLKKFIASLKTKQSREENRLFIAEGEKLCAELLESSYHTELIVVRSGAKPETEEIAARYEAKGVPVYIARKQQFDQLCDTKSPQGIIAVVSMLEQEVYINEPFIALDGVADPGNLGTIVRTADWFGFKSIILGGSSVDKFNPKTVRSTMGSLFRCKIIQTDDLPGFLTEKYKGFEIYGATLEAGKMINEIKPPKKFGLVFGNEASGISDEVKQVLTSEFKIPGFGKAESLNVAISVGVALYHFSVEMMG
jgi:TrmH family RNA methyltransferase